MCEIGSPRHSTLQVISQRSFPPRPGERLLAGERECLRTGEGERLRPRPGDRDTRRRSSGERDRRSPCGVNGRRLPTGERLQLRDLRSTPQAD